MADQTFNDPKSKKSTFFDRLIGYTNESDILLNGFHTKALIDSGSMITTVSEEFYSKLDPQPILHSMEQISVTGADGREIPYKGYIEVEVQIPHVSSDTYAVPVLVVNNTDYNLTVPVIIGTNMIRMLNNIPGERLPEVWKTADLSMSASSVVTV